VVCTLMVNTLRARSREEKKHSSGILRDFSNMFTTSFDLNICRSFILQGNIGWCCESDISPIDGDWEGDGWICGYWSQSHILLRLIQDRICLLPS